MKLGDFTTCVLPLNFSHLLQGLFSFVGGGDWDEGNLLRGGGMGGRGWTCCFLKASHLKALGF